jgi:hypothetical protein
MAEIKISFEENMNNPSLQVGDEAFYQTTTAVGNLTVADDPVRIGNIVKVDTNFIHVETDLSISSISGFLMFSKDRRVNNSNLKGYYAEVTLKNDDKENQSELFALNSRFTASSK